MKTDLTIPVLIKKLGATELTPDLPLRLNQGVEAPENRINEIVGALINIHKADINDARQIRDKFAGMDAEVVHAGDEVRLLLRNVPTDCLYDGKHVIWEAVEQITSAIRDVIFPPKRPPEGVSAKTTSRYIRTFVEHTGFLYRGERSLVTFIWGGHRVGFTEYEFAKHTAYWTTLALPDSENITGCGSGIMKAPFKGAQVAYAKQRAFERFGKRDFIGFTEKNILAAEPPNELVNRLLVFPNIEMRMEAFIRASHRGRAHPGGVGTIEEILFMLAVLSDSANEGIHFPFDLVEPPDSTYFGALVDFLRACFGREMDRHFTVHRESPADYARFFYESSPKLPLRYLWNNDFVFDQRLQKPYPVSFASLEALDLTKGQSPFDLLVNLRRFFSSIVHLSVKDPDMVDAWGADRPLIKGDKKIVAAVDRFVERLEAEDRIHPNKKYTRPYRTA